jgi:N-carbamoylputrescine amidase
MNITGYALKAEIEQYAEPIPGPCTHEVQRMAKEHNVTILAGLAERKAAGIGITQVVVAPGGDIGAYCKAHLSQGERQFFLAGDQVPIFSAGGTRFGVQLCYDAHFPELSTLQALKGAEVLFMPHASPPPESPEQKRVRWMRYLAARAYDNSVYVVACNQTGDGGAGISFSGVALILDPRGEILGDTSGDEERMLIADLKADALVKTRSARMGFFLAQRRPDLYKELSFPMNESL